MRRRHLLATLGAGTATLAGCASVLGPTPADELPSVTVERTWYGGYSVVASATLSVREGALGYRTSCRLDGETGVDVTRPIDDETYVEIQRLVVDSEPTSWQAEYPCWEVCATDDGLYDLAATVDGTTHETTIDPQRRPPDRIAALTDRLDDLDRRFDDIEDCSPDER